MPATAGRVRMPANNRVHSSAALQTHGIWQSAIGYDPYAPTKDRDDPKTTAHMNVASSEPDAENPYASFQGLLALARITGSNADEARGACKRCGRVGHLSFQCRNFLSVKDDKEKDSELIQSDVALELRKLRGKLGRGVGKDAVESDSDEEDEESEESDSDYDSEMERIIAEKNGKKGVRKEKSKKKKKTEESDVDDSDTDSGERKKRGRSKKRRSSKRKHDDSDDSEEDRKIKRKEKRRKRDDSSDEDGKRHRRHRKSRKEKRRRRSHRYSDDSESDTSEDRRRSRRSKRVATPSDSDAGGSDAERLGRGRKRSEKKSRRHRRDEE